MANDCAVTITRQNKDGSWIYCIPRNYDGGTVIGGTRDVRNWNPLPDLDVRTQMLQNIKATYPEILAEGEDFRVIKDVVGRRPTREGGVRIESESVLNNKSIVHAYGIGSRGYECSWGVAGAAVDLVLAAEKTTDAKRTSNE